VNSAAVTVVGESVLDVVVSLDGSRSEHAGGSPNNVAVGLARIGTPTTLVTEVGDDRAAGVILAHLASAGVRTIRAGGGGRTSVATATLDDEGTARYSFDIGWSLPRGARLPECGAEACHVHTGSIAVYLEPGAHAVEDLITEGMASHTVSFDPNIRAALIGPHAVTVDRTEWFVARADIVKASEEDLAWLYPGADCGSIAAFWAGLGPRLVVVTLGERGSLVRMGDATFEVAPISVDVVDTVGAGDSYMAALLDGLAIGGFLGATGLLRRGTLVADSVRAIATRASLAAAITVSRRGANPPTSIELDERSE